MTAARPLPRYGASGERARSRPCSDQLHHHRGHDLLLRRQRFQIGHQQVVLLQNQQMINAINQPRMESACRTS